MIAVKTINPIHLLSYEKMIFLMMKEPRESKISDQTFTFALLELSPNTITLSSDCRAFIEYLD